MKLNIEKGFFNFDYNTYDLASINNNNITYS